MTNTLEIGALFAPLAHHSHIGLAVSGGPDSLALLVLASDWAKATGCKISVYTVDHQLRPEARAECEMVAGLCATRNIACHILTWDTAKPAHGVQAAARAARYEMIGAAMQRDGAEVLLTAHHLDDQAETVLMRLAHGSGIAGLGGMRDFAEVEGVAIFRPFLGLGRAELGKIVAGAGLEPALDPSNADPHYERSRWRAQADELATLGLTSKRLALFAQRAARADAALDRITQQSFADIARIDRFGVVSLPVERFCALSAEVGIRLLGLILRYVSGGNAQNLHSLELLHHNLVSGALNPLTLGGAMIQYMAGNVLLFREVGRIPHFGSTLLPGEVVLWDQRFRISVTPELSNLRISPGLELTRAQLESALGAKTDVPMSAVKTVPVIRDANGEIAAIGAHGLRKGVQVAIVEPVL